MYDHMNNSVYNFLLVTIFPLPLSSFHHLEWWAYAARFDSVVNAYLIGHCSLHPPTSPEHPLAVHSSADFFSSIAYPAVAELCLRVNKLGRASVTYEVALFEKGREEVKAVGDFVHVFVETHTGRPSVQGMSDAMRKGLERITIGKDPVCSKL